MVNQMIKIPRGCVLWLDLTEDTGNIVYDHSGHGNNGKVYGAVLEKRLPFIGRKFDGVDDYVEVPDSESLDITDYTVSLWVKWRGEGTSGKNYWTLINRNSGGLGVDDPYHIYVTTSGVIEARVGTVDSTVSSNVDIRDGKWYFVALTRKGTTVSIYINGELKDTGTGEIISGSGSLTIGVWPAYKDYFNGIIAHVSIYNRALNLLEIKYLYEEFQKRVFRRIAPLEIRMR